MWPFTSSRREAELSTKLLHDRVETVERQVRSMLLEWESVYNKLRAVVARLNKRDERAIDAEDPQPQKSHAVGARRNLRGF